MSFDYCFAYEDRNVLHTSRWSLEGVKTGSGGNLKDGRLWVTYSSIADDLTIQLYKNPACTSPGAVASGVVDISDIDSAPVKCELSADNSSGMSGEVYIEAYSSDPSGGQELLVSLIDDSDLADEHAGLDDLPVYSSTLGLARYCAVATRKVLLLASQMYAEELGGYGAPEHRYHAWSARRWPDFRRLANPDQLKDAAVHWALALAMGACHQRADETMYSSLRDYHNARRKEAIAAWNLAFNVNPDSDDNADTRKSSGTVRITRL